jgi:hypothetical protein
VPGGADRRLADAERPAALLDDVDALAVDDRRPGDVRVERVGVGDVVRVERRGEADRDDQQEQDQRRKRDPVPD